MASVAVGCDGLWLWWLGDVWFIIWGWVREGKFLLGS